MITFGITGGIGTGKSKVTETIRDHGIPIIDADVVARKVVEPGTDGFNQITRWFGMRITQASGRLDRPKLGKLVFSDAQAMDDLNHIMLPLIKTEVCKQINFLNNCGCNLIGYDAALLIETAISGFPNTKLSSKDAIRFKPLIVTSCPLEMQISRLIKRNNLSHDEAMARIKMQMPTEEKIKYADYVIDTSGLIEDSVKQTKKIIKELRKLNGERS